MTLQACRILALQAKRNGTRRAIIVDVDFSLTIQASDKIFIVIADFMEILATYR